MKSTIIRFFALCALFGFPFVFVAKWVYNDYGLVTAFENTRREWVDVIWGSA